MHSLLGIIFGSKRDIRLTSVQSARDHFILHLASHHYHIYMKTAGTEHDDLYIVFRGIRNAWQFKIICTRRRRKTLYYFTNAPEHIRNILLKLSFEEIVQLAYLLKPELAAEYEILECIGKPAQHIRLHHDNDPRSS